MPRRDLAPMLLALALGCAGSTEAAPADTGPAPDGAQAYADYCAACHGSAGEGLRGPDLHAQVPGRTAADLQRILDEGAGGMPPVYVPEAERAALLEWLLATFG